MRIKKWQNEYLLSKKLQTYTQITKIYRLITSLDFFSMTPTYAWGLVANDIQSLEKNLDLIVAYLDENEKNIVNMYIVKLDWLKEHYWRIDERELNDGVSNEFYKESKRIVKSLIETSKELRSLLGKKINPSP